MTRIICSFVLALSISGCAYVDVKSTKGRPQLSGLRVYAPKTLIVVNGTGVSSLVIPDCSKEYAIRFGSFLAKNDVTLEIENGMLSKLENNQDSTALPLKLLEAVSSAAAAGQSLGTAFSEKVDGGLVDRFGVYELSCDDGTLKSQSLLSAANLPQLATEKAGQAVVVDDGTTPVPGTTPIRR